MSPGSLSRLCREKYFSSAEWSDRAISHFEVGSQSHNHLMPQSNDSPINPIDAKKHVCLTLLKPAVREVPNLTREAGKEHDQNNLRRHGTC